MPTPFLTGGFAVEAYRAERAVQAFAATGRFSSYDPGVLAGQRAGIWEPLGTRAVAAGTVGLSSLGVPPARAFDLLAVFLHLLVPLVMHRAARVFGATRSAAAAALGLCSALTFFDALTHFAWFSGRIGFVLASAVVVLEGAYASRLLETGERRWVLGTVLASSVAVTLHPVAGIFGAAILLFTAARAHGPGRRRLALALAACVPLALVLPSAAVGFVSSEPVLRVFHVGPSSLLWDVLEIPGPGYGAAGSSRTLLRFVCLGAGALGLLRSGLGHHRAVIVGRTAIAGVILAYVGGLVPDAWPMDPYWFLIPATFAASVPAAELLVTLPWRALLCTGPLVVRVGLALALVVAVPRAVRTVLTFLPELLPARVVRGPADVAVSSLGGVNEPFPDPLGYDPALPSLGALVQFLDRAAEGRVRVLTDDGAVAGFLALRTGYQVQGPIGERGAPSASADPSALLDAPSDDAVTDAFLERYGVGFIVLAGPPGPFDAETALFDPKTNVAGYRVRRSRAVPSLVARGTARVVTARTIRVTEAAGPRVTLRFHCDGELACRPGCTVLCEPVAGDPSGFVSVANPPQAFEIFAP